MNLLKAAVSIIFFIIFGFWFILMVFMFGTIFIPTIVAIFIILIAIYIIGACLNGRM